MAIAACVVVVALSGCSSAGNDPDDNPSSQSAFDTTDVTFSASDSEADVIAAGAASVSIADLTVYIGTEVVGPPSNTNPILVAFDASGVQKWSNTTIDTTGADATGLGLGTDGQQLYALFTIDGTQSGDQIHRFTTDGWVSLYGTGGGAKVTVVLAIDPATGIPTGDGTFIIAKLSNGDTNRLVANAIIIGTDSVTVRAESYPSPLDPDLNRIVATAPVDYEVVLSRDLSTALSAQVHSP